MSSCGIPSLSPRRFPPPLLLKGPIIPDSGHYVALVLINAVRGACKVDFYSTLPARHADGGDA